MANLTPEQKAANKLASQERSKAFSARRKVYDREMAAAMATAAQQPEHAAMVAAHEAFELAIAQRNDAVSAIDDEIVRLQARREDVRKEHGLAVDAAKARRDLTFSANAASKQALTDAVKAAYPDMAGVFLSSQWHRPDGV